MMQRLVDTFWSAVSERQHPQLSFVGDGSLGAVSDFASAAVAVAGLAAGDTVVDRPLVDGWFRSALRPVGWQLPSPWDSLAGDYRTADGWIRLHTNAPHHRLAALLVLGVTERSMPRRGASVVGAAEEPEPDFAAERAAEREDVAAAVATWRGDDLEVELVESGGAAAVLRTPAEWAVHPQGMALRDEPLIAWTSAGHSTEPVGFKVLDLTRVIAGPVATRFLAGLGADVLRIDPPDWDEPAIVPEMTLGKRAARANFLDTGGMRKLSKLIAEADVIVHGYRADALDRLGLSDDAIRELNPGIVDVAIDAYGWTGPWRNRRGFDSLVQMSSGIAWGNPPSPLPVQALDHATGYLAAAAALEGLRRRRETGQGSTARLSLARTAFELPRQRVEPAPVVERAPVVELADTPLETPWGEAALLASPVTINGAPLHWEKPPRPLGSDKPVWTPVPIG